MNESYLAGLRKFYKRGNRNITDVHEMTNTQLNCIIQKIEVDKKGNVENFLQLFGDLDLDEAVLIRDNYIAEIGASTSVK